MMRALIRRTFLSFCLLAGAGWNSAHAQPAAPPPPPEYKVEIRYAIPGGQNEHIAQFLTMTRYLKSIGFKKDAGPDDQALNTDVTRMTGTIASANARKILKDHRVQTILLLPSGYQLPAEAGSRVKVELVLERLFTTERQRLLKDQVVGLLEPLGFKEAVGYDHRDYTHLIGTVPADQVGRLLTDLRWQSSGWLVPSVAVAELPLPIRNAWPVEIIEVIPEPAGVVATKELPAAPSVPREQQYLQKIGPDLRALVGQDRVVRMEVILAVPPDGIDFTWERALTTVAHGLLVEGNMGPIVTVTAPANQAPILARQPFVTSVRLPRPALAQPVSARQAETAAQALQAAGLGKGQRSLGRGVRVAIIDADFRGFQQFVGKRLPVKTKYIDLTAECNPEIGPSPAPDDGQAIGHGTQAALALSLVAPEVELTLIRIDRESPYQLQSIVRYIRGETFHSGCLQQRRDELAGENERLDVLRGKLLEERRAVLDNFGQDPATVQKREAYFQKQAELDAQNRKQQARQQRFLDLVQDLRKLGGIQVVACELMWSDGYAVDGSNPLSRYFDGQPLQPPLWFQSVGNTAGQTWAGVFRDADGNGVMEFAPPGTPLPASRWTSELNFLGWQPLSGKESPEIPRGKIRVSVQWREPHDPTFSGLQEDHYRVPLADLHLTVLQQRDPSGKRLPADDLQVVARSQGLPLRLASSPTSATYEQTVEFTVDQPGRYALRVEGRIPRGIRPADVATLPSLATLWEVQPRIFVNMLDPQVRAQGRPIFLDYSTNLGSLGMPADAHQVVSVGAADPSGQPAADCTGGPALGQALHAKPDVLSPGALDLGAGGVNATAGSGIATAFAAGVAADALSARVPVNYLLQSVFGNPGKILRAPAPGAVPAK
ncbi:MAG TPA: S8 family serine peptidase [Gemmataceae bacterium]|nr:S8 family serine peptidase [Gemmataceae bacterium]